MAGPTISNKIPNTFWEVKERKFDDLIEQLLFVRRISNKEKFLDPKFSDLVSPFLIPGIKESVERIIRALKTHETIGIFADYDADGIPGAAFLSRAFKMLGIKHHVYIPSRQNGYGLNKTGIDFLINKQCTLIITIDLGTKNFQEIEYCQKKNIDIIVTDHHSGEDCPEKAYCVINPKIIRGELSFNEFSGGGVVFKLVQGLFEHLGINDNFLKWNLDLIAISTIADIVPLVDENRILAKLGLIVLNKTKNIGLKALYNNAKIEKVNSYTVGFQIGPRINAPGRLDHAANSFELLIENDQSRASGLAGEIERKNQLRQSFLIKTQQEAEQEVNTNIRKFSKIIAVSGSWHRGILGPAASKIAEKFNMPAVLFADEGDILVGSARSIKGVNLLNIFNPAQNLLEKFGGHSGAAGLTLQKIKFQEFFNSVKKSAEKIITEDDLVRRITIDCEVKPGELTLRLYENLLLLEPFGEGNPRPIFVLRGIKMKNIKYVGKEQKHLSFFTHIGGNNFKSIYFNAGKEFNSNERYDIAFWLDVDRWNGEEKLSLNIVDIKNG